ncbi:MAG: hypothetical protein HY673_13005 [Chloroflexi bacterium]|nr:hypothetical protein [Chloroflexota bacterium]
MPKIRESKFVIHEGSTGVTLSAGTANSDTKVWEYQVPDGMVLKIDKDSTLEVKDNGATESANSSRVKLQFLTPNQRRTEVIAECTYNDVKQNQDQNLKYHLGEAGQDPWLVPPRSLVQLLIKSSQALATTTTTVVLSAKSREVIE